ncbi:MAG: hypothetical protein DMG21_20055 [Acidobacteria bacterium]|nr:MAG: hypothetical protein DMG21_20055 [Acidobacteriota bacterium]
MLKRVFVSIAPVVVLLLGGAPLRAQGKPNPHPIFTYVSDWGVPRAQWSDMAKDNAEDKAVLDPLVADGTLLGYGLYENRIHSDGGYTHGSWFQASSLANLFKALEMLYTRASVTAPVLGASKHQDFLMVSHDYGAKAVSNSTGYIRVIGAEVKPEHVNDFLEAYRRTLVPVYEKLLADGTIVFYQLDSEYNIENAPGRIFSVVGTRDAEGLDKVRAAIEDLVEKNPAALSGLISNTVPNSRIDLLGRITTMTHK